MIRFGIFKDILRDPEPGSAGGGKTYTQTELDALLAERSTRVREEEKNKLYPDIDRHKAESQRLNTELERVKGENETLKKSATNGTIPPTQAEKDRVQKLEDELTSLKGKLTETDAAIQRAVETAVTTTLAAVEQKTTALRTEDILAARKKELIAEAKGEIIVAMVSGSSVEALEASAKAATEEYKRIQKLGEDEANKKIRGALPGPLNTAGNVNADPGTSDNPETFTAFRKKTSEEQKQTIEKLKQETFAALGLQRKQ